jgi:hypothetical protein
MCGSWVSVSFVVVGKPCQSGRSRVQHGPATGSIDAYIHRAKLVYLYDAIGGLPCFWNRSFRPSISRECCDRRDV